MATATHQPRQEGTGKRSPVGALDSSERSKALSHRWCRQEIGEREAIADHHFAAHDLDGVAEHGTRPGEGVKFALLAARVRTGREIR